MKEILIPILNTTYSVIVCWGDNKFVNKIGKKWQYPDGTIKVNEEMLGSTYYKCDCHPIITFKRKPKTPVEIGALAHEATHAILHIFDYIKEENLDEVFASSIEAVVRETLKT
jgi:hypothetical protein